MSTPSPLPSDLMAQQLQPQPLRRASEGAPTRHSENIWKLPNLREGKLYRRGLARSTWGPLGGGWHWRGVHEVYVISVYWVEA